MEIKQLNKLELSLFFLQHGVPVDKKYDFKKMH
jgi:hypothetical protein